MFIFISFFSLEDSIKYSHLLSTWALRRLHPPDKKGSKKKRRDALEAPDHGDSFIEDNNDESEDEGLNLIDEDSNITLMLSNVNFGIIG